ncbi:hypothetical protein GPECTOR_17g797 [Gonium pectorale]|uniref:DUF1664 domain-containing protein n=1 Tax=Gonium pectorale TaxID=33097 RepID=A0A150GK55_GONPE|nr:hypothetical protein GPECTOR_17g797 [Gonium pectorale]|eukprot:KXZ50161.1 hypothetical protein GPECTOR_17g797 [Gonium pectorale]
MEQERFTFAKSSEVQGLRSDVQGLRDEVQGMRSEVQALRTKFRNETQGVSGKLDFILGGLKALGAGEFVPHSVPSPKG